MEKINRNNRTVNLWNTRKYQGIKVADIQDIIDYGDEHWGGGGGGYEPDFFTIGLDTNKKLYVKDYVNKVYVDAQLNSLRTWVQDNYCLESFAVELDERLHTAESTLTQITPKVERALLTPIAPPTAIELVGIGTNGGQQQVNIGRGLEIVNSTLRMSVDPAKKYYLHDIFALIQSQGSIEYFGEFHVYIINDNPNPMNASEVFFANGFISPVCKYTHQRGASLINDNKLGIFRERDRVKSGGGIIGNKNLVFEVQGWNKDIEMNEITEIFLAQTVDVSFLSSEKYFIMLDGTLEDTVSEL